jgi:N-acyl-D-amino-acid deacylase
VSEKYDLVIRGGLLFDGSGADGVEADLAVSEGRISAIGRIPDQAADEIDATGCLVTPGFVDVHTHYDGQVTWEHTLSPSSNHGVTTVVMGNCGVGFAPIRRDQRELAIALMEGVEDIPGAVMSEGLPWNWESFPEYLDALELRTADVDFAAQLPHSPLRVYVMGARGAALEPPTQEDLDEMQRLTSQAVKCGAIGVSTSRALVHRFRDGRHAPSVNTEEQELIALAKGLRDAEAGVFQLIPNVNNDASDEFSLIRRLNAASGRPVSFTLAQSPAIVGGWRTYLRGVNEAAALGLPIRGQFYPRPVGMLFGLDLSMHPFSLNPSYKTVVDLPLAEKVAALRNRELRARLIAEGPDDPNPFLVWIAEQTSMLFALGDPPNYTPPITESIAARAARAGVPARELLYDELLKDDGRAIIYLPLGNVDEGRFDSGSLLIGEAGTILGLGDGGAHYGIICDASWPTYLLTKCVRDAPNERRVPLGTAIRAATRDPAVAVGFLDRGLLAPGYKADINVIDLRRLHLHAPRTKRDLPAHGRRLTQKADGYVATIVSGQVTYREGEPTGHLPGRLVRGARNDPGVSAAARAS